MAMDMLKDVNSLASDFSIRCQGLGQGDSLSPSIKQVCGSMMLLLSKEDIVQLVILLLCGDITNDDVLESIS
jgi:hypothetical protein